MTAIDSIGSCCGVGDISGLDASPKDIIAEVVYDRESNNSLPLMVFADVVASRRAQALAKYIVDEGLGEVVMTGVKVNPNSANRIRAYLWTVDSRGLSRWSTKHYKIDAHALDCDCEKCGGYYDDNNYAPRY